MKDFSFNVEKTMKGGGRAGTLTTPSGIIKTPAFVPVGTKGTVKAVTRDQLQEVGSQVVLANTYHLFLTPGDEIVRDAGGLHSFMNWSGPAMTDSGGFQVFSLGAAFGQHVSKLAKEDEQKEDIMVYDESIATQHGKLAIIDEEGVSFTSHIDGSLHRFTPERSIEIQHNIGADMIFAFDECTSPMADYTYQKEALDRTHGWGERSLKAHRQNTSAQSKQALFGIVQGGRHEELRKESAKTIGSMDFDGFGIGGSYVKEDLNTAVGWVCDELPSDRPRHLLGIGEPEDLIEGIRKGVDLFDCVLPTRLARNGTVYTHHGKINLLNAKYTRDFSPLDATCDCSVCNQYTKAYLSHLFKSKEMLGATLASIHNLRFIISLVECARQSILDGNFDSFSSDFLRTYGRA